jgi:hypothetical protein
MLILNKRLRKDYEVAEFVLMVFIVVLWQEVLWVDNQEHSLANIESLFLHVL